MNVSELAEREPSKQVLVIAGEASSDLHCASLIAELKTKRPELSFVGIGGENMRAQGVQLLAHVRELAVVGVSEVFGKLFRIISAYRSAKRMIYSNTLRAAIFVDYPEFNLKLAKHAHKCGIPVLYFISPQVWAWRPSRTKTIAKTVDKMLVLFRFEQEFYERAGMSVEFVGHPLLDAVQPRLQRNEFLTSLNLDPTRRVASLLPGSRTGEVRRLLPVFLKAASVARSEMADQPPQVILALADTIEHDIVAPMLRPYPDVICVKGQTYDALASSDVTLVASGTATLEAAILGVPMVVGYKVSGSTYLLGRLLINLDHVALPNIITGEASVPEFIQHELNPTRLAEALLRLLKGKNAAQKQRIELAKVKNSLGEPGAARRAAVATCDFLDTHPDPWGDPRRARGDSA
ncbi:lipid-A-disaccharide synthase [bacterium]|nr:lipid-A-disaccharide synthase [bacterium]